MSKAAGSLRRLEPGKRELYLTDIGLLNGIYQAAKAVLIQPDKFAQERLARAIRQAEGEKE